MQLDSSGSIILSGGPLSQRFSDRDAQDLWRARLVGVIGALPVVGSTLGLAQRLAHGGREMIHRKRFFHHDFVSKLRSEPRVIDIAGNEHNSDFRALGAGLLEQLDSR